MILLKSEEEIEKIRKASRIVAEVLRGIRPLVRPGVTTQELDRWAEELIVARGGKPAFKGYRGYTATLCTSINEQVVHGIPSSRRLGEGDIIGIDCGAIVDGFHGDAAVTFPVGSVDEESLRLIKVTKEALQKGIEQVRLGNRIGDISHAVQTCGESMGYGVVRDFVGHGIGRELHEEPQIPKLGKGQRGLRLRVGMGLAIEPMFNLGGPAVKILEDGWTAVTVDGKRSAHFEHTVALTPRGAEVLSVVE